VPPPPRIHPFTQCRRAQGPGRQVDPHGARQLHRSQASQSAGASWQSGSVPPRTGNSSHTRSPLGVYPTNDGYVAINVAIEDHWHHLLAAMSRGELRDDPRFRTNADGVAHIDETDTLVGACTQTLGKMEVFTIAKRIASLAPLVWPRLGRRGPGRRCRNSAR
jgi:crotonobetainyl-CoA:carnitine CoA-transferase CaiB-like acyl-CoA transferase